MNRIMLIQNLMKQKGLKNYLEIGVFNGHAFFKIKSTFKIAIDPQFRFDFMRKIGKIFINPYNIFNKYYSKTSDQFFEQDAPQVFANENINIALIDGMHEYQYALRDIENTLKYLSGDGVIVVHDCLPQTKEASKSFADWQSGPKLEEWNGDVWKAIVHLRSTRNDINVFVLDCDQGLGIITKREPENKLPFTADEVSSLTYEDFAEKKQQWLNLKPAGYALDYFK